MSSKADSKQRNEERLFFYAATIMSLLFGAGFCWLLFALNSRDGTQDVTVENPKAVAIARDHPRQLANFMLTARAARSRSRSWPANFWWWIFCSPVARSPAPS
jgi:hypothetical protein